MKLVKVIALKDHEWAKVSRHTGDIYEADQDDERFYALLTMGLAKYHHEESRVTLPGRYKRRDMRPMK